MYVEKKNLETALCICHSISLSATELLPLWKGQREKQAADVLQVWRVKISGRLSKMGKEFSMHVLPDFQHHQGGEANEGAAESCQLMSPAGHCWRGAAWSTMCPCTPSSFPACGWQDAGDAQLAGNILPTQPLISWGMSNNCLRALC